MMLLDEHGSAGVRYCDASGSKPICGRFRVDTRIRAAGYLSGFCGATMLSAVGRCRIDANQRQ